MSVFTQQYKIAGTDSADRLPCPIIQNASPIRVRDWVGVQPEGTVERLYIVSQVAQERYAKRTDVTPSVDDFIREVDRRYTTPEAPDATWFTEHGVHAEDVPGAWAGMRVVCVMTADEKKALVALEHRPATALVPPAEGAVHP
jgi:hypothetical protein